jgi:hypothetical protein
LGASPSQARRAQQPRHLDRLHPGALARPARPERHTQDHIRAVAVPRTDRLADHLPAPGRATTSQRRDVLHMVVWTRRSRHRPRERPHRVQRSEWMDWHAQRAGRRSYSRRRRRHVPWSRSAARSPSPSRASTESPVAARLDRAPGGCLLRRDDRQVADTKASSMKGSATAFDLGEGPAPVPNGLVRWGKRPSFHRLFEGGIDVGIDRGQNRIGQPKHLGFDVRLVGLRLGPRALELL